MGLGSEIYPKHGIEGFYFEPEFMTIDADINGSCIYHQGIPTKPMPLFLLWKGIIHTTLRFPEHKFLLGV
jgi:hypothetical protein